MEGPRPAGRWMATHVLEGRGGRGRLDLAVRRGGDERQPGRVEELRVRPPRQPARHVAPDEEQGVCPRRQGPRALNI